jgi:hypothetical protein
MSPDKKQTADCRSVTVYNLDDPPLVPVFVELLMEYHQKKKMTASLPYSLIVDVKYLKDKPKFDPVRY